MFTSCAAALAKIQRRTAGDEQGEELSNTLEAAIANLRVTASKDVPILKAAMRVLCDLARQRWLIRVRGHDVQVSPPAELQSDLSAEKQRVRRQELLKRDEQLRQPAVRQFIRDMERQRLYGNRFISIFSLMRDGRELAQALASARQSRGRERTETLQRIINPYLEFVTENARCAFTGLRLQDVWRYFRHTWTNQYTSTPGRTLAFLVRDRAAPMHPVMGIAAIGSPVVQIKERDMWIGWHPSAFFERMSDAPSPMIGDWLRQIVTNAITDIYTEDLVADEVVTISELRQPKPDTLARLHAYASEQRKLHHRYVRAQDHKGKAAQQRHESRKAFWIDKARMHLFRSKRALTLAEMLRARLALDRHLGSKPTSAEVAALLADREGRKAAAKILRKAKGDRVGIAMADITVCGAVQPYNAILGGKLAAMLSVSPEVVQAYRERYDAAESEIASSMAGRPIIRTAELVFFGTTSLYGVGSSQYNRVRIPAERLGGQEGEELRYLELGRSEAFGTSQYSSATVDALVDLVHYSNGGQRVNSIFGEGVSPKLRKIRDGLDALQFPSDHLLRHGRRRVVYGVTLVRNTRELLLGMENRPDYLFSRWGADATNTISDWWRERWLAQRIEQDHVLEEVASHTLVRPVRHGARVDLADEPVEHTPLSWEE